MNRIQIEDYKNIGELSFIDWSQFKGRTFIITGATGLIGSNLVNALAYNNQEKKLNIKLILPVRNVSVTKELFRWTEVKINFYELGTKLEIDEPVDYIVHLASPTSSKFFTEKPADTILSNIEGYRALLDWTVTHPVKKFVGLSTMEVYGFPKKGHMVKEDELGAFETMNSRNSYPLAKIACEALCNSYYTQYGIPIVVLRATQTFGPGVKYDDGRVFAQFMRCAIEKKDIVLKTPGLTERPYLYTADAVSAILLAILNADPGQAYTIANSDTYCSIKDMAQLVADEIASGEIKVLFDLTDDIEKLGYSKTIYMNLDTTKMMKMGWKAEVGLKEMYKRMINGISSED